jgi:hypothetical protein
VLAASQRSANGQVFHRGVEVAPRDSCICNYHAPVSAIDGCICYQTEAVKPHRIGICSHTD